MSNKLSTIAKNIKKLRKEKGISQDKLSKLANISYNTIIKIESGDIQSPGIDTAQKIAQAFGVKIDDLISEKYKK
jgi:transcriptional regulator with XRE-family HTH domain